jgi:cytochrome P450
VLDRPSHVPAELVVDFDFYRIGGAEVDPFLQIKALHDQPQVFWTPRNGGHWVATRGEDIRRILEDHQAFSSRHVFVPATPDRPPSVPLEIDPPEHEKYRRLILPAYLAARHRRLDRGGARARRLADRGLLSVRRMRVHR